MTCRPRVRRRVIKGAGAALVALAGCLAALAGCNGIQLSSAQEGIGGAPGAGGAPGTGGAFGTPRPLGTGGVTSGGVCVGVIPTTPVIATFGEDDFGGVAHGAVYVFEDSGLNVPVTDTSTGALKVVVDTGAPFTAYPYAGFGIPFQSCTDVSAYSGVSFTASGTLSAGCTIQFSLVDAVHSSTVPYGVCPIDQGCYPPSHVFALSATPATTTVLFDDLSPGGPASPLVVPAATIAVQWQINVPSGDGGGCTGEVTIDDVTLVGP